MFKIVKWYVTVSPGFPERSEPPVNSCPATVSTVVEPLTIISATVSSLDADEVTVHVSLVPASTLGTVTVTSKSEVLP